MSEHLSYQEIEMPNGIYVIEKRFGIWMVWSPDDDQPYELWSQCIPDARKFLGLE